MAKDIRCESSTIVETLAVGATGRGRRVMVLGLRGFPQIQGGIETHAESLYPLLVLQGFDVEVIVRSPYVAATAPVSWKGVRFTRVWAPRSKGLEALVHTFVGVLYAATRRPDVLHIHAIGPALFTPLARFLGLRVVVTHHGRDYEREKWGRVAKVVLRLGEWAGTRFSTRCIAVSNAIATAVQSQHRVTSMVIRNGVSPAEMPETQVTLDQLGITRNAYVLTVGRLVPEKRHLDLIEAFHQAAIPGWKLVIVGGADHPDDCTRALTDKAATTPNVIMAGVRTGAALRELYTHAGFFVLPSSHEGLPIALLEAMSFGLRCLASDIVANREVELPADNYFAVGDRDALAAKMTALSRVCFTTSEREQIRQAVLQDFNWQNNALETAAVLSDATSLG